MTWRELPPNTKVEYIREHWVDGYSAADVARSIGARLGQNISRDAILGLYGRHRDQLINHPLRVATKSKRNQKMSARRPAAKPTLGATKPAAAVNREKPVRMPVAAPHSRFVSLVELGPLECRWAVNEAPIGGLHLFCGCQTEPGCSWCDFHAERVFVPGAGSERKAVSAARKIV